MTLSSLCSRSIAIAGCSLLLGAFGFAQTAVTDPVGFWTLNATGGADNVLSVALQRDAVFMGTVEVVPTNPNFLVLSAAGASPGWTDNQFVYSSPSKPETYFLEFTSGNLRGVYYKITANNSNAVVMDTEGDSLTAHPLGPVAAGDSVRIRPYVRIKDVFQRDGILRIEARANELIPKDDILIPNTTSVGINKSASAIVFYFDGAWKSATILPTAAGDYPLEPNSAIILRRRNAANVDVINLGNVQTIRNVAFVPGGSTSSGNDSYISLAHAARVSLDASGLSGSVITPSTSDLLPGDQLLEFNNAATGFNKSASAIYYFKDGGWKQVGGGAVGSTKFLEPGRGYVIRKKAATPGVDWVKNPNY